MADLTVLVVEDDASARTLLQIFMQRCGYAVETAADGAQALAAVARRPPCLVVTDLNMPGIDGHELVRHLRADPATAAIPIVVVSAAWPPLGREGAGVEGADAFLSKPIELGALSEVVERLLTHDRNGA